MWLCVCMRFLGQRGLRRLILNLPKRICAHQHIVCIYSYSIRATPLPPHTICNHQHHHHSHRHICIYRACECKSPTVVIAIMLFIAITTYREFISTTICLNFPKKKFALRSVRLFVVDFWRTIQNLYIVSPQYIQWTSILEWKTIHCLSSTHWIIIRLEIYKLGILLLVTKMYWFLTTFKKDVEMDNVYSKVSPSHKKLSRLLTLLIKIQNTQT